MKTAKKTQDLKPFIELCKAGKLFEIQKWIEAGTPVSIFRYDALTHAV